MIAGFFDRFPTDTRSADEWDKVRPTERQQDRESSHIVISQDFGIGVKMIPYPSPIITLLCSLSPLLESMGIIFGPQAISRTLWLGVAAREFYSCSWRWGLDGKFVKAR